MMATVAGKLHKNKTTDLGWLPGSICSTVVFVAIFSVQLLAGHSRIISYRVELKRIDLARNYTYLQ